MKTLDNPLKSSNLPICVGTGLVALDVIISGISDAPTQFLAGGSCGNVLTILSYLGWSTYPIARLSSNVAAELLSQDLKNWHVFDDLLTYTLDGSTPIIIHRIMKDREGAPKHRFEFKNPEDGKYLPSYKPCLAKSVPQIFEKLTTPNVFYFDRINRASIDLAKLYKANNAVIIFEPSNNKDPKAFNQCLDIADVVKFSSDRISNYDELFPIGIASLEIQTLGIEGLKYRRKSEKDWVTLESFSISNAVDAAGAGDWLTAGLIYNLFNDTHEITEVEDAHLKFALQFGQALSALNCTFEGARGLMYNIKKSELILFVQHILSSKSHKIVPGRKTIKYKTPESGLKISSLFTSV